MGYSLLPVLVFWLFQCSRIRVKKLSIPFHFLPFSEASETYVYPDLNQDPVPNQFETMPPMIEINSSEPFTQMLENLFYNFQDTISATKLFSIQ